ncbi:MAG: IS66 family transposase zinc-finger binding domain-containing protein, partial [Acidimicrobiales bacterium]
MFSDRLPTYSGDPQQRCGGCGGDLDDEASTGFAARQVIDLPEVTPVVTEHRAHTCR